MVSQEESTMIWEQVKAQGSKPSRRGIARTPPRRGKFDQATAINALETFNARSEGKSADLRPVDALLDSSFTRNMFHEMFLLSAFGGVSDAPQGAYLWAGNVKHKNRQNPGLLAIIAAVIELLNREGRQYKHRSDMNFEFRGVQFPGVKPHRFGDIITPQWDEWVHKRGTLGFTVETATEQKG